MNMDQDLRKILEAGNMAPSGENCQPWKFEIKEMTVEVFNLPERDQSLYSWGQRASYMAIGAAIENMVIAAAYVGYKTDIKVFPDTTNAELVASLSFKKGEVKSENLYDVIFKRITNRKAYKADPLTEQELKELSSSVSLFPVNIAFTVDDEKKIALGKAGSVNESVMMSNEYLHQFFFSHVNWTKEEDDQKKIGFFVDTLELPPPALAGFKLFKNWRLANFFNVFGLNNMIAKQNAEVNAAAAGFGCIYLNGNSQENFVEAGRALERVWLTATSLGLSMQPLTGVLFFMYRIMAGDTEKFSIEQVNRIKAAYQSIVNSFTISEDKTIAFMFRIGRGDKPSAQSSRFSLEDVVVEK